MDYRAAGAAAYLGLGAVWAMGLSSSAAQLQANPASMPPGLSNHRRAPFTQTIFLWQSIALTAVLIAVSLVVRTGPRPAAPPRARAREFRRPADTPMPPLPPRTRPGEWLEYSPVLTLLLSLLAFGWLFRSSRPTCDQLPSPILNTYNLLFLSLGLLLHWRPRGFLDAVAKAVPSTTGVLVQFPLYGGIAMVLTQVAGGGGETLAHRLSSVFVQIASADTFALVMGAYSAVLGFFVPSGGGKWIIEAPYVMQAANELQATPGLGRADLQRRRSPAEPDQSVLDAAAAGRAGAEGARHRRFHLHAVAGAHPVGAGPAVAAGFDACVYGHR